MASKAIYSTIRRSLTKPHGGAVSRRHHLSTTSAATASEPYPGDEHAILMKGSLLMGLKEVAVSSGSACTSASLEPSYVLRALGVDEDMAHTSIRFGIGRFTTEEEIDKAVELTVKQVEKLREMSPLYEMVKEGIDIKNIQWSQH
ncbi:BnaA09g07180D [Brassica napus]|uniref:BnaA09g07180D protein n=1 Tax=Brassica napus TaxID=3708 RepID=A0A078G102_BRANA|nr:BnaA09g07180D [Brassica napus]